MWKCGFLNKLLTKYRKSVYFGCPFRILKKSTMKKVYLALSLFLALMPLAHIHAQNNNVGIGTTTPDATAILDVTSSNKGVLVPRLTTAQRTAITTPAQGLLVYDAFTIIIVPPPHGYHYARQDQRDQQGRKEQPALRALPGRMA